MWHTFKLPLPSFLGALHVEFDTDHANRWKILDCYKNRGEYIARLYCITFMYTPRGWTYPEDEHHGETSGPHPGSHHAA